MEKQTNKQTRLLSEVPGVGGEECRDDSEAEEHCCSSGGLEFGAQHPHGGSQSSITPVPDDLVSMDTTCTWCSDMHASKTTHTHRDNSVF